ncbi:MAG: DUF2236 domain-containing protein [Chloroflexi bacterium]|nr:DUF2236 domain-containing protein [Chloroflexota bacterium]
MSGEKSPYSQTLGGQDGHAILKMPSDYAAGYEKARQIEPEIAANYIAHTTIGDPEADPVVDLLFSMPARERNRLVQGCMDQDEAIKRDAPEPVRNFFEKLDDAPEWFDPSLARVGIRGFHANLDLLLQAFVAGVLVEGFTSYISKPFVITGRLREQGVRRLKQNNRHVMEIFLPGGMERYADGLKLSVRIRLTHAQIRRLLLRSDDWDVDAWGMPLSAAHIGLAAANFSARMLMHSERIGAAFSKEERDGFMHVWRYSAHLMGVPEAMLWKDERDALKLYDIGIMCEPPIDFESIIMANSLVNAVPAVVGITDSEEREKLANLIYTISRALIGDDLADQLKYPKTRTFGVLPILRMRARYARAMRKVFPGRARAYSFNILSHFIDVSAYDEEGISYDMPTHAYAERSEGW